MPAFTVTTSDLVGPAGAIIVLILGYVILSRWVESLVPWVKGLIDERFLFVTAQLKDCEARHAKQEEQITLLRIENALFRERLDLLERHNG